MSALAKTFRYHGLTISVRCDESADLAWLEEFLSPLFAVDDTGVPACRVSLSVDSRRYADLLRRGPRPGGGAIVCFANDTNLVSLPLWASPEGERTVFDRRSQVFLLVRPECAEIEMVAGRSGPLARPALMRVVRELAMMHVVQSGGLLLHGAAIGDRERGVVIAGPKRSGKTTLLMHVLRAARIGFASNDRVAVFANAPSPSLRGLPTIITIRHQTATRFPELSAWLPDASAHYRRRLSEPRPQLASARRSGHQPVSMSPAQFCSAMQVSLVAEATLKALLFPRVTGRPGSLVLTPLDRGAAAERLRAGLFRAQSPVTVAPGLAILPENQASPSTRELLCSRLLDAVQAFDCELGREAYARPEALSGLVRDVLPRA